LGYGIYTSLKKGLFLKAKVQLIDVISSNEKDHKDFEEILTENPIIDLKKELETLGILDSETMADISRSAGFSYGYEVWNHYKKGKFYSLEQVVEQLNKLAETNSYSELSQSDQDLINHLHWMIYSSSKDS